MNRSRSPRNWSDKPQSSPIDALNRSIADLEARIAGLNARSRKADTRSEKLGTASEMVMRQRLMEREQRARQQAQQAAQQPRPQPEPPRERYLEPRQAPLPQRETVSPAAQTAVRETGGAMRDIAEALVSLRDDLRRDISDNMNREFASLRNDVDEIKNLTGTAAARPDLSQDLANLAGQLEALETRRAETQGNELRSELDELRTMVNDLAREDSMRRLESRWDGFEEQISGLNPAETLREDLITLSYRLDDIKSSIGMLPSTLPLNALEDKIKMLVTAIDAMARQPAAADPEIARQFSMVDERLDEISRAIVASSVSNPAGVEAADIQRLETRLESVVDSVTKIAEAEAANIQHLQGRLDTVVNSVSQSVEADASNVRQLESRLDAVIDSVSMAARAEAANIQNLESRLQAVVETVTQSVEADASNIRLLEHRLDAVADSVSRSAQADAESIQNLHDRLEAVVDSVAESAAADVSNVQRLEHRLDSVVDQIGRIDQATQGTELSHRLEALSTRVEELANDQPYGVLLDRLDQLSQTLDERQATADPQLVGQLAEIANKVETLDLDTVNEHVADQLKALSMRIDNITSDLAATNSNQDMLYGRLEDLAESVSQSQQIDLGPLEERLADIAARMDLSQAHSSPSDEAIRNLESQVAGLSKLLASPNALGGGAPELEPRIAAIEDQLLNGHAASQDLVIETARQAAEAAVASFQQTGASSADISAIEALVGDLRSLEDLSRQSEERNARTIDAVHGTLMKIAERLDRLESEPAELPAASEPMLAADMPSADRYAPDAPYDYGRDDDTSSLNVLPSEVDALPQEEEQSSDKAFLSGLMQRMTGDREPEKSPGEEMIRDIEPAPSIDPVEDIDPETANMPLEPGSGAPDIKRIMAKVREAQSVAEEDNPYTAEGEQAKADKADFIAAARRAARAAASEAAELEDEAVEEEKKGSLGEKIKKSRRPLLLAAGAILLAVLSYPLVSGFIKRDTGTLQTASIEPPTIEQPATPPVTETVTESLAEAEVQLPEVRAVDPLEDTSGGILVARNTDVTLDAGPSQFMSTSNEIQSSDRFVPPAPNEPQAPVETAMTVETVEEPVTPAVTEPAPVEAPQMASLPTQDDTQPPAIEPTSPTAEPMAPKIAIDMPPEEAGPLALREAAKGGDVVALFEVGARYTDGRGVQTDLAKAAKWYGYAAELGFAPAQYRLANFHEKGTGVKRDLAKAMTWYQMAAEQGNASAMHNLAVLHAMGQNGAADYDSAGGWFTKAADLGVKDSQYNLAILHARGSGVQQDLEESYKWFAIAADSGDKDAAAKRDEVANALTPEQLESARAKVELWKPGELDEKANSVRVPSEWRGVDTRTASVDMKKAVRNIQAILNKNGFDTGGVDGVMGKNTVAAIKAFQTSVGLKPTGEVDDELVKALLANNN